SFLRFGFMQFDQVLVGAFLDRNDLATYSVVRRFAGLVGAGIDSLHVPIQIRAASMRYDGPEVRKSFVRKGMRFVSLVAIPACVSLALGSPWLTRVFAGEQYAGGWPVLILLAMVQML